jgi:hypothetical protein
MNHLEHSPKIPRIATGRFGVLGALHGGQGSGVRSAGARVRVVLLVTVLALFGAGLSAASASAAHSLAICAEQGSAAGQCGNSEGVAVDQATGDVYVADGNNHRISEFTKEGTFVLAFGWGVLNGKAEPQTCTAATGCQVGLEGFGVGQFGTQVSIAVDNSGGSSEGEVYVSEPESKRVQKFTLNPLSGEEELVSLFGPDVTLSGPDNHTNDLTQTLTIGATSGLLNLCFKQVCVGAEGKAEFTKGSNVITKVKFEPASPPRVGQAIEAGGFLPSVTTKIVEVDESAHTLTLSADATAGSQGGNEESASFVTGPSFDASAATVQSELDALATIGGVGGSVSVSGGPGGSNPYVITFDGSLGSGDVPMLSATDYVNGKVAEHVPTPVLSGGGPEVCKPASGDTCQAGSPDSGEGGFSQGSQMPVAVGSSGEVWVGDLDRAEEFSPEGAFMNKEAPLSGAGTVEALALEKTLAGEDLYVLSSGVAGAQKVEESGVSVGAPYPLDASGRPRSLGVDPATGDLFVSDQEEEQTASLFEYSSTGAFLESFGTGAVLGEPHGNALAFGDAVGGLYVAGGRAAVQLFFPPPPGPQVQEGSSSATPVKNTSATLHAVINPENAATNYHFEYIGEAAYRKNVEETKEPFAGATSTEPEGSLPGDLAEHPVSAAIAGLSPETTYHLRVVATNANAPAGGIVGEEATFTTLPPVEIESESASGVTATSATLQAQIDPLGSETTYYFEYSTAVTEGCALATCTSVPIAPGASAGAGEEPVPVSVHLQGLVAGTAYRYRVIAVNALTGPEGRVGEDHTFTTQGPGSETSLPDGRSYEMVTPPNKHGAGIFPIGREDGSDIQAAADGEGITYAATAPFAANPRGSRSIETTQALSTRTAAGSWETADISTPHNEGASQVLVDPSTEYFLFSSDLSLGIVEPKGDTPLPPLPPGAEKTVYARHNRQCASTPTGGAIPATCYQALVSAANVPEGTVFGGSEETEGGAEFVSASPDLGHVVLETLPVTTATGPMPAPSLTETAVPQGGMYEFSAGRPASEQLQLVDILPPHAGKPEEPASSADLGSYLGHDVRHAISDDGSRIFWTQGGSNSTGGALYMRDMTRGETIQVDAAENGVTEPGARVSVYQTANGEGSRVFFTSRERLTADSKSPLNGQDGYGSEDLYVFELTSREGEPLAGKLSDLTVPANANEHAGMLGVIGASEDGTYVYFVAGGVLGDGATGGADNLYVEHYDTGAKAWEAPRFIAALAGGDSPDFSYPEGKLLKMTSRVSPNGRYLAFMSESSLTGYDNRDANSGEPDEEVFEYHAPEDLEAEAGSLVCASCDPTGARPVGLFEHDLSATGAPLPTGPLVDDFEIWSERWLAGNIPQWTPLAIWRSLYQSRYLSDSGRLFFDSSAGLVPADVNGKEDVYEYEPQGVPAGSPYACSPQSTDGSDVFEAARRYQVAGGEGESGAGCVALISAGTSSEESAFLDASESGGDVFFMTSSKLSPADYDTSYDIYDAHECTSESPCAPAAAVPVPPCETEASCKAAPSPQPGIYGAPSSATFSGAGDLAAPPPAVVKPKPKTVKCKRGFLKKKVKKKEACVKRKKAKAKKPAHTNRRAGR